MLHVLGDGLMKMRVKQNEAVRLVEMLRLRDQRELHHSLVLGAMYVRVLGETIKIYTLGYVTLNIKDIWMTFGSVRLMRCEGFQSRMKTLKGSGVYL